MATRPISQIEINTAKLVVRLASELEKEVPIGYSLLASSEAEITNDEERLRKAFYQLTRPDTPPPLLSTEEIVRRVLAEPEAFGIEGPAPDAIDRDALLNRGPSDGPSPTAGQYYEVKTGRKYNADGSIVEPDLPSVQGTRRFGPDGPSLSM